MRRLNGVVCALSGASLLAFAGSASAATSTWHFDTEHSSAMFAVKHLGLSTVHGEMGKVTGTLHYDDADVTKSSVEATIDVTAINTREPKRDAHLKSDAFFDVAKYPNITFKSKKVEKAGDGALKVSGDLTIRGKTNPVVLDVDFTGQQVTAYGDTHMAASATTKINRQDYGVSWNTTVDTGGLLVGDDVKIELDMDFVKDKAPVKDETASAKPDPKPKTKKTPKKK